MINDLKKIWDELGITDAHVASYKIERRDEAPLKTLEVVALDYEGRPFVLEKAAGAAWAKMREAARSEGVILDPFSGFRSYVYQKQMIKKKLENGQGLESILTWLAIPGFSEHHTGRAIDICTDNVFDITEAFERTDAFTWLRENGAKFKFRLSYPRENHKGIIYEPWHWFYLG